MKTLTIKLILDIWDPDTQVMRTLTKTWKKAGESPFVALLEDSGPAILNIPPSESSFSMITDDGWHITFLSHGSEHTDNSVVISGFSNQVAWKGIPVLRVDSDIDEHNSERHQPKFLDSMKKDGWVLAD